MRILSVTHFFAAHGGGIEIVAGHLAEGLALRGMDVKWAATEICGEVPERTARIVPLPMTGLNLVERLSGLPIPVWSPASLRRLRREVEASDVIHCHDGLYVGTRVAVRAAREAGRPAVLTQHIGEIPFESRLMAQAMRLANRIWTRPALRRSSYVVFVSDAVARFFSDSVSPGRSATIYNGVDGRVFRPNTEPRAAIRVRLGLDPVRPLFLFVGRFVPKKGLHWLRQAAERLTPVDWVLIGRGPIDPRSWALDNVRVVAPLKQEILSSWYGAADLLVLPSVGEGLPLVVQEAMSCGLPCLVPEETLQSCLAVRPLLLSAGSGARNFVTACREAVDQRDRLEKLREPVAHAASSLWSWERCVGAYLDLFAELLTRRAC